MIRSEPSRREFLGRAAAAGVAGAVGARLAQSADAPPDPGRLLRCGVVGVGNWGSTVLQRLLEIDGVTVAAVADTYDIWRNRALGWCRQKNPKTAEYVRFEDMFQKEKLDAAFIATPDHIHAPAALAALEAGADVYVEIPMALTWEEARAVRERAAALGAVVQVGSQCRSTDLYQRAREIVQAGRIGRVVAVQVNRHIAGASLDDVTPPEEATEASVHWDLFLRDTPPHPFDPKRYFQWPLFEEYSHGIAGEPMLHHLDACQFITGHGMPAKVAALGGAHHFADGRTLPDTLSVLAEFPEGMQFNHITTLANNHFGVEERYLGTLGTLYIRDARELYVFERDIEDTLKSGGLNLNAHIDDFLACVRSRETPAAPADSGFGDAAVAHMAALSFRQGKVAAWDPAAHEVIL